MTLRNIDTGKHLCGIYIYIYMKNTFKNTGRNKNLTLLYIPLRIPLNLQEKCH